MAEIKPFRGIRYNLPAAGNQLELLTPPYDVIDKAEQERLHGLNRYNFVRLEYGKAEPGDGEKENQHTRAAQTLQRWLSDHILIADEQPRYYLYGQVFRHGEKEYRRLGLFAALNLEPYGSGAVLPHELTMTGPKRDRLSLLRSIRANTSPIFTLLADRGGQTLGLFDSAAGGEPLVEACGESGEKHSLWAIDDPALQDEITAACAGSPLLIADGHHRYETALEYCRTGRGGLDSGAACILAVIVSGVDPGLLMLPTHRLLHGLGGEGKRLLESLVEKEFVVLEKWEMSGFHRDDLLAAVALNAPRKACLGLVYGDRVLLLAARETGVRADLPVTLLHDRLLDPLLAGLPGEAGAGVTYPHDPGAVFEALSSGEADCGFILDPVPVERVFERARRGMIMPQKSTFFYPKLPGGLLLYHHHLS